VKTGRGGHQVPASESKYQKRESEMLTSSSSTAMQHILHVFAALPGRFHCFGLCV
jgi:hypothetical protein